VVESNGEDVHVPWFSGICLEGEVAGQYEIEGAAGQQEPEDTGVPGQLALDGLGPITIFVGANNSGKSRLMRELFKAQQPLSIKLKTRDNEGTEVDIGEEIPEWITTIRGNSYKNIINNWIGEEDRSQLGTYIQSLDDVISRSYRPGERQDLIKLKQKISGCGIEGEIRCPKQTKRFYIPILRGMRPPLTMSSEELDHVRNKDLYEDRTTHDYFNDIKSLRAFTDADNPRYRIFTGLTLYDNLRRRLLARTQAERKTVRDYESFLSENFFPGQIATLIPVEEGTNDVVHIRIGDNDERPIYDLGDGMQSLIICTYPIVTETEPGSLFFLEEPDLCMHPSLQRTFLEVLKTYHRKMGHQFLITTHSNHLLDLLEDNELVSIFSFSEIADRAPTPAEPSQVDSGANSQSPKPKPSFRIRPSNLKDRQTLLELGVRPSATYLANATIWVEGVSDCAYLRAYMEAFVHYLKVRGNDWGKNSMNGKSLAQRLEEYTEDRHYAFVEYSGANLTHFSFGDADCDEGQGQATSSIVTNVPYLCSKAIVIADGDITDSNKGDRWNRFVNQLDERFIGLPCKEIENLIPDGLMQSQVLKDDSNIDVTKLTEVKYADYRKLKIGLGDYLSNFDFVKKLYKGKSGTLTAYRKKMWSSNAKGIPWLVRQAIERDIKRIKDCTGNPENTGNTQSNEVAVAIPELPSYLTQDLIWLSVCLYTHIAECNHDTKTKEELKVLQEFIRRQGEVLQAPVVIQTGDSQPCPETDNTAESAAIEWPIKNVNRSCLLTAFLCESNTPE
jgi:AAA15 family ATPase/GTPase